MVLSSLLGADINPIAICISVDTHNNRHNNKQKCFHVSNSFATKDGISFYTTNTLEY